ncbi:MAG: TetR/AcrR family transcriptional regulator [Pseudomonadota bacterium]
MTIADQKRPRARNARPKIERAALELFIKDGVDAATTRNIADVAGVSEGALYRHYKGKDELALTLFLETHNRLGDMMLTAFSQDGTLKEKVRGAVSAYCAFADEDWLSFSYHLVSLNRYLPHDTRRDDDPVSVIEKLIQHLMDQGDIPKGDPAILAAMSLGIVMQSGLNKIYNRLPGTFSQHVDTFTKAIMAILLQK